MPTKKITKPKPQAETFDRTQIYPIKEAVELVKKNAKAKFDETVEVHFRLGIDAKKGEQQVRGTVVLPHAFGKAKTVAAFVPEAKAAEAKEAGADIVYTEADVEALKKSAKIEFDIAVASPEIMKALSPLARILGPKGLMPSPKNETIAVNLKKTISELKKGKVAYKNDDSGNLHQTIGKVSTDSQALVENFDTLAEAIKKAKPEASKGTFMKGVTICSTMGPGVKVDVK